MALWRVLRGWGKTGTGTGTGTGTKGVKPGRGPGHLVRIGAETGRTYIAPYNLQGHQEEGGQQGRFAQCPTAYGPQKDRYTLIEQSNTLLKQSLHIFCPGPPSSSLGSPKYKHFNEIS